MLHSRKRPIWCEEPPTRKRGPHCWNPHRSRRTTALLEPPANWIETSPSLKSITFLAKHSIGSPILTHRLILGQYLASRCRMHVNMRICMDWVFPGRGPPEYFQLCRAHLIASNVQPSCNVEGDIDASPFVQTVRQVGVLPQCCYVEPYPLPSSLLDPA